MALFHNLPFLLSAVARAEEGQEVSTGQAASIRLSTPLFEISSLLYDDEPREKQPLFLSSLV
jgi:hypothetical protein